MARVDSRRMHQLRDEFFADGERLDAVGAAGDRDAAAEAACWICKQRVDYTVPANTTPSSHALDHYYPVSQYPELQEDPANFRHSHTQCNGARGNGTPSQGLGEAVADWW